MDTAVATLSDLVDDIRAHAGPVRLVGIDGCGGAGKTTFASRLAVALGGAPTIHTDDFASHDDPIEWWPRLLRDVVDPLLRGDVASYVPYDWVNRRPASHVVTVEPAAVVLIEGVTAIRAAWRDRLAFRVWVDCPRDLRLARGIERDGEALRQFWLDWMRAEDKYVERERPWAHADAIVDGSVAAPNPEDGYIAISGLSEPR